MTLEKLCPYAEMCATEYGDADVCANELYTECIIYDRFVEYFEELKGGNKNK